MVDLYLPMDLDLISSINGNFETQKLICKFN